MKSDLSKVDLNLLVIFQVLMEKRSVTLAANHCHVTQPAMSNTLSRLRDLFDDPLFTRSSQGLIPTPKANQLYSSLPGLLEQLATLVLRQDFTPLTSDEVFSIAAPEPVAQVVMPRLLSFMQTAAPNIRLITSEPSSDHFERLSQGELDFTFQLEQELPSELVVRPIGKMTPKLVVRKGHPLTALKKLTLSACLQYSFVAFKFYNFGDNRIGHIEPLLEKLGLKRNTILETGHLLTALNTVGSTDSLLMMPDYLSYIDMVKDNFEMLSLPKEIALDEMQVVLVSHRRTEYSASHQWLSDVIYDMFGQP